MNTLALRGAVFQAGAWLRHQAAQRLGLHDDDHLGMWLLRVVFRQPRPGHRDWPVIGVDFVLRHLQRELALAPGQGAWAWLWRLFIRSAPRRHRFAADLRRTHRQQRKPRQWPMRDHLQKWLAPVYRKVDAAWQRIAVHLPTLDWWEGFGERLEPRAAALDRVPYLRSGVLVATLLIGIAFCTTPMSLSSQYLLFFMVWIIMMLVRRIPGRLVTLLIVLLSGLMTGRYVWWRSTQTLHLTSVAEGFVGYLLFAAEVYTWLVLLLGYVQTAWPLNRKPRPLPDDPNSWPTVDVFIPTYNEPLSVVRPTVIAAKSMDWPRHKMRVYILDDGTREAFRQFAEDSGVGYITREEHGHAKAGNINHALTKTRGDYIAIFDCDHIPTRSFLQTTMGEMVHDPKCAVVQTPHHFFSPDPFERNYDTFHRVPNEGSLFYGLIQDGNDFWDATFFCGSCAVIKRQPLEEVGGIAVDTVTEDAHTSLRLHRRGYRSAYLRIVQAAGLATESLSGHIGQRIRWARGMAQIFRVDNPLFGPGLSVFQRLCYSNAMMHFFYGIPRLIFLSMPCAYLLFGLHVINAQALTIVGYVLPYLLISSLANSRIQGKYRHSYWAEVYETVLAWYIVLPTTIAFINPKLGKFNVTAKGGKVEDEYLDWAISKPYIGLLLLNLGAVLYGLYRMLFQHTEEPETIAMNLVWAFGNLAMLGVAVGVARESKQVRVSHHIPMRVPATLLLKDGHTLACKTQNYSTAGLGLLLPGEVVLQRGERVGVCLSRGALEYHFPARVARVSGRHVGVTLEDMTTEREIQLVQCTFGRADAWLEWEDEASVDAPLQSFLEVVEMAWQGYLRLFDAGMDAIEAVFTRKRPHGKQA